MAGTLILRRFSPDDFNHTVDSAQAPGTHGVMVVGDKALFTVEKPWRPGEHGCGVPNASCVPAGVYELVRRRSPSKGLRYHLVNPLLGVFLEQDDREHPWQRYSCMFHPANSEQEVSGCIGVGEALSPMFHNARRQMVVTSSTKSTLYLERFIADREIRFLQIVGP